MIKLTFVLIYRKTSVEESLLATPIQTETE